MNGSTPSNEDLSELPHRFQVAFALFCAKQVIHLVNSQEANRCIRLVELWLSGGEVSSKECLQLGNTTYAVAASADYAAYAAAYAAYSVTTSTHAASYVAAAANYATSYVAASTYAAFASVAAARADCNAYADIRNAQWVFYKELLEFDAGFEREVLTSK